MYNRFMTSDIREIWCTNWTIIGMHLPPEPRGICRLMGIYPMTKEQYDELVQSQDKRRKQNLQAFYKDCKNLVQHISHRTTVRSGHILRVGIESAKDHEDAQNQAKKIVDEFIFSLNLYFPNGPRYQVELIDIWQETVDFSVWENGIFPKTIKVNEEIYGPQRLIEDLMLFPEPEFMGNVPLESAVDEMALIGSDKIAQKARQHIISAWRVSEISSEILCFEIKRSAIQHYVLAIETICDNFASSEVQKEKQEEIVMVFSTKFEKSTKLEDKITLIREASRSLYELEAKKGKSKIRNAGEKLGADSEIIKKAQEFYGLRSDLSHPGSVETKYLDEWLIPDKDTKICLADRVTRTYFKKYLSFIQTNGKQ